METNFFGMLRMSHAFAPVLGGERRRCAAQRVVDRVMDQRRRSWRRTRPASRRPGRSRTRYVTSSPRNGTQVLALHMAFVDTDLARGLDGPKTSPDEIVARALDGLEDDVDEVLADERTRLVKQGLSAADASYLPKRAA